MPILDVQAVLPAGAQVPAGTAQALADAVAAVLGAAPGRVWVRWRPLDAQDYAENASELADGEWPVFVTLMYAHPPQGEALGVELAALTQAIAQCLQRPSDRVHIEVAPAGAGRMAFGGRLVG